MLLSLNPVIVGGRAKWPELAAVAAKAGFAGVEVPIVEAMSGPPNAVMAELAKNKVQAGAIGLPLDFRRDEDTFKKDLAGLPRAASFAAAIGCPRMATYVMSSADIPKADQRRLLLGRLKQVADILKTSQVRLGLEFLGPLHIRKRSPYEFIYQMGEMLDFARDCGSNCGLLLDSWHWHHAGGTVDDILKAGKEAIVHVHLADSPDLPPEKIVDSERLLPGEGVVNFDGFFQALRKIGYTDAVSPEVFGRGLKDMSLDEACRITQQAAAKAMKKAGVA
jgi:sugar phosphate isomerase/epimerase